MRRLLFVNGPPRSGKDHFTRDFTEWAKANDLSCETIVLSDLIKDATHAIAGLPRETPPRIFEAVKDLPNAAFGGATPRHAYISVSDSIRLLEGPACFARRLQQKIEAGLARGFVVMPGVGFADEVEPIAEAIGRDDCLILRFGGEFNDSRSRLALPGVAALDVEPYAATRAFDFLELANAMNPGSRPIRRPFDDYRVSLDPG
jgi:hypothetical protein